MAKLFVGQISKATTSEQLMPLFQPYGSIIELAIIKDKMTGAHKGCAFLTYTTQEEADACIAALHNKHTLPGMANALQVKYSGSSNQGGHSGNNNNSNSNSNSSYRNSDNKLFIGMVPKAFTTEELMDVVSSFGPIEELSILRGPDGQSKGCAFLRFVNRDDAVSCVTALNGALKLPGAPSNLVVKFAESERDKRAQQQKQAQSQSAMQQLQLIQLANLVPLLSQQLYAQSAWDQYSAPQIPAGQQSLGGSYSSQYAFPGNASGHGNISNVGMGAIGSQYASNTLSPVQEGPPGANLFIYNLPPEYTDMDLYQVFSPFGNIVSAKVYTDKETHQSRGFGFVNYDTPEAAQVAVSQMDGLTVSGKRLKVQVKVHQRLPGRPY